MKFTLNKHYENKHLAEIQQALDVKFAFVKRVGVGHYTNVHPMVKCRDFLGDCLYAIETKKRQSIYNFSFDPAYQKIYKKKLMLVMQFPAAENKSDFINNIPRLLVELIKVKPQDITFDRLEGNYLMVTADPFWLSNTVTLSYFTFLLKCASYKLDTSKSLLNAVLDTTYETKTWDDKTVVCKTLEANYYSSVKDTLPRLQYLLQTASKQQQNCHGLPYAPSINTVHNDSGFYSTCKYKKTFIGQLLVD